MTTTTAVLRILSLAALVVAARASAQSSAAPARAQATPRTLPPVRQLPRATPPAALPALPSARQTPTRPIILPPQTRIVKDSSRSVAAPAANMVTPVADVAPPAATQVATPVTAPLPIINQPGLPPANATGRCKDGTFLTGGTAATDANCSTHGGLGVAFQVPSAAPQRAP